MNDRSNRDHAYALGYTEEEHLRLSRQAAHFAPFTERVFRAAGIGPGDRVLDLGSGVGDVSLLARNLVGPSGSVVGIERDAGSIARAEARMAAAGFRNVSFVQSEASAIPVSGSFDALIGRFILMYLPAPAEILQRLRPLLRPGAAVAVVEPGLAAARGLVAHLPLYSACMAKMAALFTACGVDPEIGVKLHRIFADAGLPEPSVTVDIPLSADRHFTEAMIDLLKSLAPQGAERGIALTDLGTLETLGARLHEELVQFGSAIPWLAGAACAWCRLPEQ